MQVRVLGAISESEPVFNQPMGGIGDKKKDILHGANRVNPLLIAGRAAFLALIKLNVWGMATNLNLLWARSSAGMNNEKQRWINAWYNLGGIFSNIQGAVVDGRYKRAIGLKLAPDFIKNAYSKATGQSIGAYNGIGEATLAGTLLAAGGVITALTGLITTVFAVLGRDVSKEDVSSVVDPNKYFMPSGTTPTTQPNTSDPVTAGFGGKNLLFVGIAAATVAALAWGGVEKKKS